MIKCPRKEEHLSPHLSSEKGKIRAEINEIQEKK